MFSPLDGNALYCSLRYNFNITGTGLKFDGSKLVWNHYFGNRLSESVDSVNWRVERHVMVAVVPC